jgi:cytochrome c553
MNRTTLLRHAACGLALACAATAMAAVTGVGEQIAKYRTAPGAPACVKCHGATGQGLSAAGFPRLAGMNADYLVHQLVSFHDGTRVSPVMGPVAKLLTATDRRAVADYFAALPVVGTAATAPTPAAASAFAAGATLALRGGWSKGVPACTQCHGAGGWGVGATFPQIAGQSVTYITSQLHAWRLGTRKNDPMGLMHGVALKLTDADIGNVATYYASQAATPTHRSTKP